MQNFDHLLTTRPHDIHAVFVADLHLSAQTTALNGAFLALLKDLSVLPNLHDLYILGDWLDGWIGDDDYLTLNADEKAVHWLTPILHALKKLSAKTNIYIMHGNRDFAIRQTLCDEFGGRLIKEPHFLNPANLTTTQMNVQCKAGERSCTNSTASEPNAVMGVHLAGCVRLEHGDRLCTDDKSYQRYRKIIQNPFISWLLLKQPLAKRRTLAQKIKSQSQSDKSQKSANIMDTNDLAVKKALNTCDVLIHGHTHRPFIHHYDDKKRMVLGDWRHDDKRVSAIIGACVGDDVDLWEFYYMMR